MKKGDQERSGSERWAEFKFSVVGGLLASPPQQGELRAALSELAARTWRHPISGAPVRYGYSTIERWYYKCLRDGSSPVSVLRRKVRADKGGYTALDNAAKTLIEQQYKDHSTWKYQLHADNILVELKKRGWE